MIIVSRDRSKRKTTFLRVLGVKSAATFSVLALVLSIFVVVLPFAAASAGGSPATPPTVEILSPYEIIEPSSKPNDKDGYPPQTSEADVEESIIQGMIVVTDTIYNPVATLVDDDADDVDDLTIDDDNPRDLDMLDGLDDDQLAPGTYYVFWNLNKTGYVPVPTPHGAAYNGSNSASISVVGDIEKFTIELSYDSDTVTSPVFTIEMEKSASIKQNDLDWMATAPEKVEAGIGDVFTVRTKYHQNSANGMKHLISQVYFNGLALRLLDLDIYYYNNYEPGDIEDGVPGGWEAAYYSRMELTPTELVDTDNKDYWVMEYTFEIIEVLYSDVIPYTQTIKKGNSWKVDTGYEGFQSEVPEGVNPANLTIEKYFSTSYPDGVVSGPNPPEVGQTTVYELTIEVMNIGGDDAIDVVVTDTIPIEKVTWENVYTASQGTVTYDSGTGDLTWDVGTLGINASATLSFQVSVTPIPEDVGNTILLNSGAYVTGTSKTNEEPVEDGPTPPLDTEPVIGPPDMNVYKTADKLTAIPGDQITYTISYENVGYGDANNVVIQDTIPAGTTYVSSSPTYESVLGNTYTWHEGTVAAGVSDTITLIVEVNTGISDGTVLTNYVTLDYEDMDGDPLPQESDSVDVTVYTPIMTISKTADFATYDPGDEITYTITYTNTGGADAYNVVIQDTIPPETTYVSSTPTYDSVLDDTYTWNIGMVAAGGSGTITLVVEVDPGTPDQTELTNYVSLDYTDANDNAYPQQSDSVTVTVTAPSMTITKTADKTSANPGDYIIYTIYYENTGTGDATGVTIEDTIPMYTTYVSSNPTYDSVSGSTYTWNIGTVAEGASGTITLTVQVDAGTPDQTVLINSVTIYYDDANENPMPPEEDDEDVAVTAPVMTFSKSVDLAYANPGDTLTYTLFYENTGTGDAANVVVEDTIPADTTFVSSTPMYSSVSDDTYTYDIGNVAAGASGTITVIVTVDAYTPDQTVLTNYATLDYTDVNGNAYDQLDDSAETTVTAPDMTISKTASTSTANPGDTIIYTIYYENLGTGDAANVVIEDLLSGYETLVSTDPMYTSYIGNVITWELGTVAGGASGTITVEVTVNAGTPDDTIITNTVTLDYTDVNGNAYPQESDTASVEVTAPIMTFSKTVDKTVTYKGDTLTYTLTYENTGDGEATGVTIVDYLPTNTIYISATPAPTTVNGQTLTWDIASVPGNSGPLTITIQVEVGSGAFDHEVLHNVATLDYADANGNYYPQLSDYADTTVLHGSICGTVFNDLNFNGIWDAGEPGIPGVTITLSTGGTTVTDGNGYYCFPELPPGTYTVTETNLPDWSSTTPDVVDVTLGLDEDAIVNFGDAQTGKITGTVWNDIDRDGIWDANENGIWSVTVTVYDTFGTLVATTTTDYDGYYMFENLAPGDYTVVETNLPGWISSTPDSVEVSLSSGEEERVNFGDYYPYPPSAPSYAVSIGMAGGGKIEVQVGETATLSFSASNSGDVGSRLRFITFTAAIYDNTVVQFIAPYTGHYEVYLHDGTLAWSGDVDGTFSHEKHGNFDRKGNTLYDMVTWTLPEEAYLEGGGEVKFSFQVYAVSTGSSKVQFFPRSTEDHHSSGVPLSQIIDKKNIWEDESTGLWYPAHNSYDPWDDDINSGHVWRQWSWDKRITNKSYSKAKAEIIVKP